MANKKSYTARAEANAPTLRVHIVRKGDTLRSLARFYLGDPNRLNEIVQLNRLESSVIKADDELVIPNR